ncbi:MAG TPA: prepilin-type N-terminal cleavage/methylation domain-containing protein [Planctomycetes bacterium]|nr:prepilin-type N-terminal cleavage/methylation domain-containing protein [Planctomycetota bacterium]
MKPSKGKKRPRPTAIRERQGFTLMELVVALAVIALLAGVTVPMLTRETDEARIDRAKAEVEAIGMALRTFQSTLGSYPDMDATGSTGSLWVLFSGPSIPTSNPWSSSTGFWTWMSGGGGDLLDHHLFENAPGGQTANRYATSSWQGPYLDPSTLDPWGRPYVVNVVAGWSSSTEKYRRLWVLSAGPDGAFQTSADAGLGDPVGGDDIGFLVQQR